MRSEIDDSMNVNHPLTSRPASRARGSGSTLGRPTLLLVVCLAALALGGATSAGAAEHQNGARPAPMLLGLMDDALLGNAPAVAFPVVHNLHAQVIRYDLSWARTAPRKPADATNPDDTAYDWSLPDSVVARAAALDTPILLTIEVTPRWAGGGTGNKAPVNMASLQAFAYAAAIRYSGQHVVPTTGGTLPVGDTLGGLERTQYDEPSDTPIQLPLLEREAGLAGDLRQDPQGDLHRRSLRRHARRREGNGCRRRDEAELLRA